MEKLNFKINTEGMGEFRSIMDDLSKISPKVKMKIIGSKLLLYAVDSAGESSQMGNATILAFKTYLFPLDHFFDIKINNDGFEEGGSDEMKIDWIIKNVKTFNKKLSFFSNSDADIKGSLKLKKSPSSPDTDYTRMGVMSDGKFKFTLTGDEPHTMRDISLDLLNNTLDQSLSEVTFSVPTKEFLSARSAGDIEGGDENKIVNIELKDGSVYFSQINWELLVGKTDFEGNRKISFDKKYLKSINPVVDEVHFAIFPSFVLFQEGNQKLMISFEQSF